VVVTDPVGRILIANPAFLRLVAMPTEAEVKARPLTDWVGVSDQQFASLLQQVRRQGIARRIGSRLMSTDASVSEVEISAALLTEGDQECIGFTIHGVPASPALGGTPAEELVVAIESLTATMGATPLSTLLEDSAALVRAHFARIALARCGNDPVLAASMLGVDPGFFRPGGSAVPSPVIRESGQKAP
jgi:hypothetical protein